MCRSHWFTEVYRYATKRKTIFKPTLPKCRPQINITLISALSDSQTGITNTLGTSGVGIMMGVNLAAADHS